MPDNSIHQTVVLHAVDAISAGAILGAFAGMLPPLAAFVAVIWYAIQIYESHTIQKWFRLWRLRLRKARMIDRINSRHLTHVASTLVTVPLPRHRIFRRHRKVHPPHVPGID